LSFDIFENKCHVTRAVGLTPKSFFILCMFEMECRVTRVVD